MLKTLSQISKIETTSDRGMKLTIHTQELVPSDKAELMNLHNQPGWLVFAPSGTSIREEDIPDEPVEFDGQKTPSEWLKTMDQ